MHMLTLTIILNLGTSYDKNLYLCYTLGDYVYHNSNNKFNKNILTCY